ncbi:MAG: ABC transporter substrate-binding protein [Bacillota bacterium]|nr:ABC transporter substrate-binding protein [Bacillota bacterium]
MTKLRKLTAIVIAMTMILTMVSCAGGKGGSKDDKVTIGYIGPLTGDSSPWGIVERQAVEMYVNDVNAAGGINGKKIDFKVYDTAGDSVQTTNAARKAIQKDGVKAFIGPDASTSAIALGEVCAEYGVPFISTCATNYKVTQQEDGSVLPYSFRICLSDPQIMAAVAEYAHEVLKIQKVAIIYSVGDDYSVGCQQNFTDAFKECGGEVVTTQAYQSGDVDFRAQLTNIKSYDFDALFIPATYKELGLIANQARALGMKQRFLGPDCWLTGDLLKIAAKSVEGGMFAVCLNTDSEVLNDFKAKFKKKYDYDPAGVGTDAFLAADAFIIVKNAIEKADSLDSKVIAKKIEETKDLDCLTGKISYNPKTHNPIRETIIYTIKDGKFVNIDTYTPKIVKR